VKRVNLIALGAFVALGLAACDRPARTVDRTDPARDSVALRPAETSPRAEKAAPQPTQSVQSTADAKSDSPATDQALSEKVRQALVNEHGLNTRDLQVSTHNGVVTLSGKVDEKSDQERMMLVAMSIDGVRSVVSNLVVDRPA
jgi:hyperosmotically inducible periplasmic protein